jgi:hypothetical protein
VYTLLTTPEDQLGRVLAEELGGAAGGSAGTALGVGACLAFGIATSGWGLLACGVVGGLGGGYVGTKTGEYFYEKVPGSTRTGEAQQFFEIDTSMIESECPSCHL